MCAKLIIGAAVVWLVFLIAACDRPQIVKSKKYLEPAYIAQQLVIVKSLDFLRTNLYHTQLVEVTNSSFRFAFFVSGSRGVPTFLVHCYEQTRTDLWLLRGYFPITLWNFREDHAKPVNLNYALTDDGVIILTGDTALFSIKSLRGIVQYEIANEPKTVDSTDDNQESTAGAVGDEIP